MSASTIEKTAKSAAATGIQTPGKDSSDSKKLLHVLTRSFIKGRNAAIDQLETEKAQQAGKSGF